MAFVRRWTTRAAGLLAVVVLLLTGMVAAGVAAQAAPSPSAAPPAPSPAAVAALATALQREPVYRSPRSPLTVDAARLQTVLPKQTYVALLGEADVPAGVQADELPALLSSRIGEGGTFVIGVGSTLYGASTLVPGRLADDLQSAQADVPAQGDATPALLALAQSISGPGDIADPTPPPRAGSPVGGAVLVVLLVVAVAGAAVLWWVLKRPARRSGRSGRSVSAAPKTLVEVDHAGRIVRVTPASERADPSREDPSPEDPVREANDSVSGS